MTTIFSAGGSTAEVGAKVAEVGPGRWPVSTSSTFGMWGAAGAQNRGRIMQGIAYT